MLSVMLSTIFLMSLRVFKRMIGDNSDSLILKFPYLTQELVIIFKLRSCFLNQIVSEIVFFLHDTNVVVNASYDKPSFYCLLKYMRGPLFGPILNDFALYLIIDQTYNQWWRDVIIHFHTP